MSGALQSSSLDSWPSRRFERVPNDDDQSQSSSSSNSSTSPNSANKTSPFAFPSSIVNNKPYDSDKESSKENSESNGPSSSDPFSSKTSNEYSYYPNKPISQRRHQRRAAEYEKLAETPLIDRCMKAIKERLFYHSTTKASASSLQKNGFSLKRKSEGLTNLAEVNDAESSQYHYFSSSYKEACYYARILKDKGQEPVILRVVLSQKIHLQKDPHETPFNRGVRTKNDIKRRNILDRVITLKDKDLARACSSLFKKEPFSTRDLSDLRRRIRNELFEDDSNGIKDASSYVKEEEETAANIMQGLVLLHGSLKEGDTFSVDPDDLD